MNEQIRSSVKKTMQAKKISQTKMAEGIGLEQPNISRYLRGGIGEVPENWQKMFDFLELSIITIDNKLAEKLEQLTTLHGEDWLLDRLEVLAALEDKEKPPADAEGE